MQQNPRGCDVRKRHSKGLIPTMAHCTFVSEIKQKSRPMNNVSILVPETAVIEAVADPNYMIRAVNSFLETKGKKPLFNIQLVGLSKEIKLNNSAFSVHTDKVLKEVEDTDLIFIPAISGDIQTALNLNKK